MQCKWARGSVTQSSFAVTHVDAPERDCEGELYAANEIDAFAAYCPDNERCYYIPFASVTARTQIRLRLAPTQNNQRSASIGQRISSSRLNWDGTQGP